MDNHFIKFDNKNDIKPYCEKAKDLTKEVKLFRKVNCLNGLGRQVLNIVLPRFVQFVKTRCSEKAITGKWL